ncbi:type II secretion system protein [Gemmiger sp.]
MKKIKETRGFTLVELIVVLVILAVLAALLVPALTGYIDKAKKSQVIAETRMLHTAIQTEMSELYAKPEWQNYAGVNGFAFTTIAQKNKTDADSVLKVNRYNNVVSLSEVSSLQSGGAGRFGAYITPDGKTAFIMYYDGGKYIGMYFGDTNEYMAIKANEAPEYTRYLLGDQIQCISSHYSDGSPNPVISKSIILMSIGYNEIPDK